MRAVKKLEVDLFASTGGMLELQEAEDRSNVAAPMQGAEGCGCGRTRRRHHR